MVISRNVNMMKQLFVLAFLLAFGTTVHAEEARFDSVSYAFGDKIIRLVVENKVSDHFGFELDKKNLAEMIRGMEENLVFMKYSQDSIKKLSFNAGQMISVFMADRFQFKMEKIPFDCILAGVMKVVNHELMLPQDTIKALEFMKSMPEDIKPEDLPEEDKCRFFTDYGMMKGLQPGLQAYIHEITGKDEDEAPADYEAYAAGVAMMVKWMSLEAKEDASPYGLGVLVGSSIIMMPLSFHFTEADFLDGCRAAAGLDERKMTTEESDRMISTVFPENEVRSFIIQE